MEISKPIELKGVKSENLNARVGGRSNLNGYINASWTHYLSSESQIVHQNRGKKESLTVAETNAELLRSLSHATFKTVL